MLSLIACITLDREYMEWVKNAGIPTKLSELFYKLENSNRKLRYDYGVNELKHGKAPHFLRSNLRNAIGSRANISLEQFYNPKLCKREYSLGLPHYIQIDEMQNFLIMYNNLTVELLGEVYNTIEFKDGVKGDGVSL
jgi:hypothetical protein